MNIPLFISTGVILPDSNSGCECEQKTINDLCIEDELETYQFGTSMLMGLIGLLIGVITFNTYISLRDIRRVFNVEYTSMLAELIVIVSVIIITIIFFLVTSNITRRNSNDIQKDILEIRDSLITQINEARENEFDRFPDMKDRLRKKIDKIVNKKINEITKEAQELSKIYS